MPALAKFPSASGKWVASFSSMGPIMRSMDFEEHIWVGVPAPSVDETAVWESAEDSLSRRAEEETKWNLNNGILIKTCLLALTTEICVFR